MNVLRHCSILVFSFLLTTLAHTSQDKTTKEAADVIVITITPTSAGKYIKEGDKAQKPVIVKIGQTVIWKNTDLDMEHTATSVLKKDGKPVFDTGAIDTGKMAKIIFDQKLFENAGGKAGEEITLEYVCTDHKRMKSTIILRAPEDKKKRQ
jgi:plastocyanin